MEETLVGFSDLQMLVLLHLPWAHNPRWPSCRITIRLQWRHRAGFPPASPLQSFNFR